VAMWVYPAPRASKLIATSSARGLMDGNLKTVLLVHQVVRPVGALRRPWL
jgi:hypothetical protein